jgi:hypothetical protein
VLRRAPDQVQALHLLRPVAEQRVDCHRRCRVEAEFDAANPSMPFVSLIIAEAKSPPRMNIHILHYKKNIEFLNAYQGINHGYTHT